jgi:biotin carboxyl carrier protein
VEAGGAAGWLALTYEVTIDGRLYRVVLGQKDGRWHCSVDGSPVQVDAVPVRPNELSLIIGRNSGGNSGGISYDVKREKSPQETHLWIGSSRHKAEVRDPRSLQSRRSAGGEGEGTKKILAAMPGKVVRVLVKERDPVEAGQGVVVVEAMKMQNELKSPKQGAVQKILVAEGASVNAGDVLLLIE